MRKKRNRLPKVGERKSVVDRCGDFLGYTVYAGNGLYDHLDQNGKYIKTTDSPYFDFKKCYASDDENDDE